MAGENSFDFASDRIETYQGKADFYNLRKVSERGHEISRLPFSIKILLENAIRHSKKVPGANEAANRLLEWPKGIGSELPFMPFRVLLQDYTGVPLIVDLAAIRDEMAERGRDPTRINSVSPLDLVIDHSIQVDRWGTSMSFEYNIEREYERNSERYALLKWAQDSFKNMRVFPPGKGICHQVNLEYLSKVVAVGERDGRRFVCPDTLVGTDSHTPMVNGLGLLGWGVGGMEAEAVMLGEPCHISIPRVVGVQLQGELQEGVTPTDLVLSITELLRGKNLVDAFVEFFGDGYLKLSVPDRATLGNMSPEYGATVGFSPVDKATLRYLFDTGREEAHIKMVEEYLRLQALFLTPDSPDARYSEVVKVDLSRIEPSIAGPRNPEERRLLRQVPSFIGSLIAEQTRFRKAPQGSTPAGKPVDSGTLQLLQEEGPGQSPEGIADGSVIIAAITSCTNTSNPTVMIGAGLLARNAVRRGLAPKPFVKCSLAPGSTVVKDYLQGSGLLTDLDQLGFNLVGYGCTTCISQGTPILLANGTTLPIEKLSAAGGALVFGPTGEGRLEIARQSDFMRTGLRDCVRIVLQDGRSLICTPDHRVLRSDGRWVRADALMIGRDRVVVGLEGPLDEPGSDEAGYVLRAATFNFTMDTPSNRARTLAFVRLVGHLLGDGSISVLGQGRMNVGQAVDREVMLNDIELVTGLRPAANRYDERKWTVVLPMILTNAIAALTGVQVGRRIEKPPTLPAFVSQENCPVSVVREFLGGLFGADGRGPVLHRWGEHEEDATLEPPGYSQSTIPTHLQQSKDMLHEVVRLLTLCGVKTEGSCVYEYPTRRALSSYPASRDGIPRIEVRLELPDGLSFVEHVGFRYCVDKAMRASAAAVYWRLVNSIQGHRLWMAARIKELHQNQSTLSFSKAQRLAAAELLEWRGTDSMHPVVSAHYSLLEGSDRFSRLLEPSSRKFQPLHRDSSGFPSPVALFKELGIREWFAASLCETTTKGGKRYCVEKEATTLPTFSLKIVDRRPAGQRLVYDLTIDDLHAFVAGTIAVHNCIGNSGPLAPAVERTIKEQELYVVAALSGNRNFDGRIHPMAKGAFLMSPMLVVAYALAGNIGFDFSREPMGLDKNGTKVYLKDLWPSLKEIKETVEKSLSRDLYRKRYSEALVGDETWKSLSSVPSSTFPWDESSTYVRRPPWFSMTGDVQKADIKNARVLALFEDKITTDHISPAGMIPADSPAGKYLLDHGVKIANFSTYGSRRGNHEVMVRGGFSNTRLKNLLAEGRVGGFTKHYPSGEIMTIYDASARYLEERVPLVVIAGKQYGTGSSRDWAAKAPKLLGVKAVIAESFERIHRSNLIAMGVLPLEFAPGDGAKPLGLKGDELYEIEGMTGLKPGAILSATAKSRTKETKFKMRVRIDNQPEMEYFESGGVLPYVFKKFAT